MSQNLEKLIGKLQQLKPDIDAIEVADVLWLSQYISLKEESFEEEEITPKNPSPKKRENKNDIDELEDEYNTTTEIEEDDIDEEDNDYSFNPNHAECHNVVSLKKPPKKQIFNLGLARELKPLKRKIASKRKMELDIESTIDFIADTQTDIYQAILKPKEEKEFSLSIVIDKGDSMFLWNNIVEDFIKNITTYGIFSKINFYYLSTDEPRASLYDDNQLSTIKNHRTIELNHRNNIIFILTDCVSLAWRSNSVYDEFINFWTKSSFVSIVQMLPQSMWKRTSINRGYQVNFTSNSPHSPLNNMLEIDLELIRRRTDQDTLKIPILSFDNYSFEYLSKIITSTPNIWVNGIAINNFHFKILAEESEEMSAKERVDYFFSVASPEAQKLAIYCSVLPLTLGIIKEVQKVQNLEQDMSYIAEFYFGKLLVKSEVLGDFDFYGGVRELLRVNLTATDAFKLSQKLSNFIQKNLETSIGFNQLLYKNLREERISKKDKELIKIFLSTLRNKGGKYLNQYKKIIDKIEKIKITPRSTYIFGHTTPDSDSIIGAISLSYLKNKLGEKTIPSKQGEINQETSFILDYFNLKEPILKTSYADENVYLVDFMESLQAPKDIALANILGIVDHHKFGDLTTVSPLEIWVRPFGSSNTIIKQMFDYYSIEIPKSIAGAMLCAILSDTVILKSPTTTKTDVQAVRELAKIAEIDDPRRLAIKMFIDKSNVLNITKRELILRDFKDYNIGGNKIGIGQFEVVDLTVFDDMKEQLFKEMSLLKIEGSRHSVLLLLTDIMKEGSQLLVISDEKEKIEEAFSLTLENNQIWLPKIMSRKMRVVPYLERVWD